VSYLHCPTCAHAYNIERDAACPRCPKPVAVLPAPLSPTAEIVACAVALSRAIRRASPAERDAARASLGLVRAALAPPSRLRILRKPTLLAAAVVSLLARVSL
jgi:hypothetical protein